MRQTPAANRDNAGIAGVGDIRTFASPPGKKGTWQNIARSLAGKKKRLRYIRT
jgi:hypothetical protein